MDIEKKKTTGMYEISPLNSRLKVTGGVFGKGRYILGRSESCDLTVKHEPVSAVHAVIEIFDNRAVIYDMNSTNGTYVEGEKVVTKEIKLGQTFALADADFTFNSYVLGAPALPPVLDALEPAHGEASVKFPPLPEIAPEVPKALPKAAPKVTAVGPRVVYPLAADPKAEFSEYIFEDKQDIFPIFKYDTAKQAVEVIILFNDSIYSVDYLPEAKHTYSIAGVQSSSKDLEFPYMGKNDKIPFVDASYGSATVHTLPGFSSMLLSDKKKDTGHVGASVQLEGQDLLRLQKDNLQIFVRNVAAPPKVASAPILRRDPDFQKYLGILLFIVAAITVSFNVIEVPEDEKKDDLAPERLATILYKQPLTVSKNKAVEKTENAPKVAQKAPDKPAVKKEVPKEKQPDVKKPDVLTTADQTKKPDPGKPSEQYKKPVKQGTTPVTKPTDKIAGPPKVDKPTTTPAAASAAPIAMSQINTKTMGHVEVYKSADFSSSVSTLVAKSGSLTGVQTKSASGSGGTLTGASTGVSTGTGSVKSAEIQTSQGSLVGSTTGVLGNSKGAEGLSAKSAIYSAGIPAETVVLGSMDPDVIRRILLQNLRHFRSCYQQELNRAGDISGVVKMNFTIGASGHVSAAGIDGSSSLPAEVKKCVVNVLRGIQFPEPMGGGTVEVKQPMNFYSKTN